MEVSFVSAGMAMLFSDRCRWTTLGGSSDVGRSFIPSSNLAWDAIFVRLVLTSYQMMFRVVSGTNPRNIPLRALLRNFALCRPGGRIHTRAPNVLKFLRFSRFPVASSIGDFSCPRPGIAFKIRSE